MRKNEVLEKDIQNAFNRKPLLNAAETGVNEKTGNHLRKLLHIASLAVVVLFFNACMTGYVATEPAYIVYARPPQPSNVHIWIDGNWNWNSQSQIYVQKAGYWESPRHGQTYMSGYWKVTPQGKAWSKGHWQSSVPRKKNHSR